MTSTRVFLWLFLIFGLSICIAPTNSKEIRVVCYYTNWSVYRPGTAKFSPQNINPYLCTHLIYAFGGFTKENTLKPFDKYQDIEKGGYAKFTGLKTYNKNLKTLLAIGGWNEASSRFSPMVASADRRKQLVKNTIKFLRQNHFDGLDLDWEYPAFREGGKPRDKDNYAKLVQELREEFDRESEKTGRPRLLLTMAVPAGIEYINKGYDIPKLTKYLDWMNILSYDYHSAFEPAVNHHAPLYPLTEATEYDYDAELNIDYTIKHYLELGAEPDKLVMGIPTYGRSYTLFNPDANAIGDPADGPGEMGEATRENGYLAYYEICENVKSNEWTVVQPNEKAMGPYAYKENQWVGYDDENIARKKAEYVAENGLGGIMFWAIDNDDFRGSCHGKPYPLIEAAKEALIAASGLPDDNLISPPSKPTKSKSRLRNRQKAAEEVSSQKTEGSAKTNVTRRRNRLKTKANNRSSESDDKSKSRRNEAKKVETASTYSSLKVITPAYTTPEPPSTPDQGGAFKCEDEGFFPHPKDCKKYFWCLNGPGELGIVAHQFTCPAGLYFNKAADSCDYSQNVLCNKKLSKTTSTTEGKKAVKTTTEKASTAAPTRRTTTRITTTTEAEEYEDEYEYEDDVHDSKSDSEEDPKVIKELLDLIRKAGGIEELEKQFNIGHDSGKEGATTPSTRTKSLVEKFLTSRSNKNTSAGTKYTTINRNSRGPQNAGIEKEEASIKKTERKPQYTTITRSRPTSTKDESEDADDDKVEEEKPSIPKYTSIRRSKDSSTTENRRIVDRNRILGEEDRDTEDSNRQEVTVHTTPQYVNIRRQRPTTEEQSSTSKYVSIRRSTTTEPKVEVVPDEDTTTSRYISIRRSTTAKSQEEEVKEKRTTERADSSVPTKTEVQTSTLRYQTLNRQSSSTTDFSTTPPPTTEAEILTTVKQTTFEVIPTTPAKISVNNASSITEANLEQKSTSFVTGTSPLASSTEEYNPQTTKSPVLFEPRPFSVEKKSTISTTYKPVRSNIRTTPSPTKVSDTTVRSRFRRPLNKNVNNNNVKGVSDNSLESDNNETIGSTPRPSRSKSRFSRPDLSKPEDPVSFSKPAFRQRTRPLSVSSTEKTLSDREQDEIQRKYRPLSLDDLSSLTAADIAIQKGSREGGFRRSRIRTTTTESSENKEVSTPRRRTFERSRTPTTDRSNLVTSSTTDVEQNEIRPRNRSTYFETTSSPELPITDATPTRRRVFNRTKIDPVQKSSTEISNDLNDQAKSGSNDILLEKPNESSASPTEFTRRPPKRMRKVLRRLRTSTLPPSEIDITSRGKPLSYASLNLEVVTTSEKSSSKSDVVVVDTDSNEASISDESLEEDENIRLSATNIRENSDNAIYDIGSRKFKKVEIGSEKTSYGTKNEIAQPTTTISTTDSSSPRTRKIIRRLRPTESKVLKELETSTRDYEKIGLNPNRGRKIIRRLKPSFKSNTAKEKSPQVDEGSIVRKNNAPQFFERRRTTFRPKYTTSDALNSTPELRSRYNNLDNTYEKARTEETEKIYLEKTTQRGSLRYKDIVRSTTISNDNEDFSSPTTDGINNFNYFTPPLTTLEDDQEETKLENESKYNEEIGITTTESYPRTYESSTLIDEIQETNELLDDTTLPSESTSSYKIEDGFTKTHEISESSSTARAANDLTNSNETSAYSVTSSTLEATSPLSPEDESTSTAREQDSTNLPESPETTSQITTTTTEYIRKSTLRSLRLRPTYQIRRLTTSTTTEASKELKQSEKPLKFFTRKKPSFRLRSTTESASVEDKSSDKPRRRYPFSKYGRSSTTTPTSDKEEISSTVPEDNSQSNNVRNSLTLGPVENTSTEEPTPDRQKFTRTFGKLTTETYQDENESNKSSDVLEKQRLRNKSLFSKKRKMNIPVLSSETKEESTTEHYTTLYHVFAEPDINENETKPATKNETHINSGGRIEPLVEINRIIEVHIKNGNDESSGVNNEAKSIFDKIGAINRVTSIKVVDGNGTKIADLPLDQTSQRLAVVHDIIAQEKKNEAVSENRKDRKFNLYIKNAPNNQLNNDQGPVIIDGISHIKVITPKPILSVEASTIALEALFTTTEKSGDKSTTVSENELLDTEYSRFVNIRVIKPVDGRSIDDGTPADTPKVIKLLTNDEDVTMEAKVVEVTPKNSEQIRIAPIQVAMARSIADTPIIGINKLNERISNTPFRPSVDTGVN